MFGLMKGEKGFTLIEIMVVLVILGVLATISVPAYTKYVRKAKISEAISNVGIYGTAIRIYRMEEGKWPQTAKTAGVKAGDFTDIHLNENFFGLDWVGTTGKTTDFEINVTTDNFKFDADGTFKYTIDDETFKGTWTEDTYTLLTKYAPYLDADAADAT